MKSVKLENMFEDGAKQIQVPDASLGLISRMNLVYNWICELFKPDNISKDKLKSLKNAIELMETELPYSSITTTANNRTIYQAYRDCKKEEVQSQILKSTYGNETLYSIPYLILFYSFFKYDKSEDSTAYYSTDKNSICNDDIYISCTEQVGDEYKTFFKFNSDNRFFQMMDLFCGQSWRRHGVTHNVPWSAKDGKNLDLVELLTKGYYKNQKNNKYYILFENEDEGSENEVVQFIRDCIKPDQYTEGLIFCGNFEINIGRNMLQGFSEHIINTLRNNILYFEQESSSYGDYGYPLCDGSIDLKVKSSNEYVEKYFTVFEYGYNLTKEYIYSLLNNKVSAKDIIKDESLRKIINVLTGAPKKNDLKMPSNPETKTHIFDYTNHGTGIFEYFKKNYIGSVEVSDDFIYDYLEIDDEGDTQINLGKFSDNEKKNIINSINIICSKTNSNGEELNKNVSEAFFNSINQRMPLLLNTPLQFYETMIYGTNTNFDSINSYEEPEINPEWSEKQKEEAMENARSSEKSKLQGKINQFCKIDGTVLSKLSLFCVFDIQLLSTSTASSTTLSTPSFKLIKKYSYSNDIVSINDIYYQDFNDIYKKLGELALANIIELINAAKKARQNQETTEEFAKQASQFDEYIKSRFATGYFTEKDYFYINDTQTRKKIPVNPFVDIEFNVPYCYIDEKTGKGQVSATWIPVTSVRIADNTEKNDIILYSNFSKGDEGDELSGTPMHAGTYFNSFEITDNGGVKEINLSLKSSNDMNLERIIYNSLSLENRTKVINGSSNQTSIMDEILKSSESNFRIRFGYRDLSANDSNGQPTTITSSNISDEDFIDRVNIPKPVQIYPWTYFKITGLDSTIKDGEDEYNIKGVSSGSYILSSMSLCGISANFSKDTSTTSEEFFGSPKNVVGKIAKWIMMGSSSSNENEEKNLSTARICFLGDKEGTIITDFDNASKKFKSDYVYELRSGRKLNGGNIESIENFFYDSTNSDKLTAKNFNITNNVKSLSIKEILDSLVKWLPTRIYYIGKLSNGDTLAVYLPYESIYNIENFFNVCPFKTESMKYQVIEADACIYPKGNPSIEKDWHKTYFIRMYYEGPSRTLSESQFKEGNEVESTYQKTGKNYLRIYNYRSLQEQVIENIEISSNDAEFANTISSVTMLGAGAPVVFNFDKETGVLKDEAISTKNGEIISINSCENDLVSDLGKFSSYFDPKPESRVKPCIVFNNSNYLINPGVKDIEEFNVIASTCKNEASLFFSTMQNKLYTGEMTILGDPFYCFDSSVEAGKYEIYLQMNRVEDPNTYKITPSRYSGIYYLTGIKQAMDTTGKYTTTLSITKRIFGSSDSDSDKKTSSSENE